MKIREQIAKQIGFPLQDATEHTRIFQTYRVLKESQYFNSNVIEELQLSKLKKLIEFAYNNTPYYTHLFNSIGLVPKEFNNLTDINKIPILTKDIARQNTEMLISKGIDTRLINKTKTGGTTGIPMLVLADANSRSFVWGSYYRWFNWMEINYYDKVATFWGANTVLSSSWKDIVKSKVVNFLQNNIRINSFNLTKEGLYTAVKELNKFKPVLIKGYLSSLLDLAYFIQENNIKLSFYPKAISTTTETLFPIYRKILEDAFNCPVFDQYGCGEVSGISYECSHHQGLHVTMEHVLFESLDNSGNNVFDKLGKVVVTDLDNYAMPFIRFENGDICVQSNNKCSCGMHHTLITSIEGRHRDTVQLKSGSKVHGVFFTDIFNEIGLTNKSGIRKFQIIQNSTDKIELRLEADNISEPICKLLYDKISPLVNLEIKVMESLEKDVNGKFRYIINNISDK